MDLSLLEKDIVNTMYFPPIWDRDGRNFALKNRDALCYTTKTKSGKTELVINPVPKYKFYRTKGKNYKYPRISISENEVDEIDIIYYLRNSEFCKSIGLGDEYRNVKNTLPFQMQKQWMLKNIVASPYLYSVDFDIEDQFKLEYYRNATQGQPKFKKSFMDIEVDIEGFDGKVISEDPVCPINCITFFDENTMTAYAFLLDNQPYNKRLQYIKNNITNYIESTLLKKLPDYIEKNYVRNEKGLIINFYNNEDRLIIDFFNVIHKLKPDFCGIWYIPFDIPYILNRLNRELKIDPTKICCHPDVPNEFKRIDYKRDPKRDSMDAKNKGQESELVDWCNITGYTQFYDARSMYSNIRKRFKENEYSLDAISNKELGEGKVPLSDYDLTIRTAAYKNYDIFLEYALTDTLRLYEMERKNNDLDAWYIYSRCTRLSKCHNVSIIIRNILTEKVFTPNKEVSGNNVIYEEWGKISGAMVAETYLCDASSVEINGKKTNLYRYLLDYDASSQYPSLTEILNICKSTVHYKGLAIFVENVVDGMKKILGDGDNFHQLLQTRITSIFELGQKYFNLPSVKEMNDMLNDTLKLK